MMACGNPSQGHTKRVWATAVLGSSLNMGLGIGVMNDCSGHCCRKAAGYSMGPAGATGQLQVVCALAS